MLKWLLKTVLNLALCALIAVAVLFGGSKLYNHFTGGDSNSRIQDFAPQSGAPALASPPPVDGMKISLEITEEQGASLLQSAISPTLSLSDVRLELKEDGSATLSGKVDKDSLRSALESRGELPRLIKAGINSLPFSIPVSIELSGAGAENGQVRLEPGGFSIGKLSIGADFLPKGAIDGMNQRLSGYAKENGIYVTDITISKGLLKLSGSLEGDNTLSR